MTITRDGVMVLIKERDAIDEQIKALLQVLEGVRTVYILFINSKARNIGSLGGPAQQNFFYITISII